MATDNDVAAKEPCNITVGRNGALRLCKGHGTLLKLDAFNQSAITRRKYLCKVCENARNKEHYSANKQRYIFAETKRKLGLNDLTYTNYLAILHKYDNRCIVTGCLGLPCGSPLVLIKSTSGSLAPCIRSKARLFNFRLPCFFTPRLKDGLTSRRPLGLEKQVVEDNGKSLAHQRARSPPILRVATGYSSDEPTQERGVLASLHAGVTIEPKVIADTNRAKENSMGEEGLKQRGAGLVRKGLCLRWRNLPPFYNGDKACPLVIRNLISR
jgi:hypothetical protein